MIPPSRLTRPPFRFEHSSLASLGGLERVVPPVSLQLEYHGTYSESDLYKPLPPSPPRKASSVYSKEEIIDYYIDRSPNGDRRPSNAFSFSPSIVLKPREQRSSVQRPQVQRENSSYSVSDSIAQLRRMEDGSIGSSGTQSRQETYSHTLSTRTRASTVSRSPRSHSPVVDANELAKHYQAALPQTSQEFLPITYGSGHSHSVPSTSANITQIVDQSLVPPPLHAVSRTSSPTHSVSHISSKSLTITSSQPLSLPPQKQHSLSVYARRALKRPSISREEKEHERIMSIASAKYPYMAAPPTDSVSKTPQRRRSSVQDRLSNLYSNISHFSLSPSTQKSVHNRSPMSIVTPRTPVSPLTPGSGSSSHRSPAIPITPYQRLGTRAWELEPDSPVSPEEEKSPKKERMSFLSRRRARKREEKRERWREEVKKNIVIVGPSEAVGGGWI